MKVRIFVSASAAVFAAWLGLTFVREVPRENYPELGRGSHPVSAKVDVEPSDDSGSLAAAEPAVVMD
jgi:hypothetical protein